MPDRGLDMPHKRRHLNGHAHPVSGLDPSQARLYIVALTLGPAGAPQYAKINVYNRQWLAGRDCPAVYGVLDWLSEIIVPSIDTGVRQLPEPSFIARPISGPRIHAPVHRVEGYGWGPDHDWVRVSMASTSGFLASWGGQSIDSLNPCWRSEIPEELREDAPTS